MADELAVMDSTTPLDPATTQADPAPSGEPISGEEPGSALTIDPSQGADGVDGRRGPLNIRQSIKAVAEWAQKGGEGALPEHAEAMKQLGSAYFREQAYKQVFPTPQEATSAKTLIDGVGGVEGIKTIQTRIQSYDQQDEALRSGNPSVLDAMFKDFPEGAAALAPHYLSQLQKANPEAYAAAIAPQIVSMLEANGFYGHVEAMGAEKDPARREQLVNQLVQWAAANKQAKVQQTQPAVKPDNKAAEAQTQREQQFFQKQVEFGVRGKVDPALSKVVDSYAKQNKLSDTQKKHYQEVLQSRLVDSMNNDKTYTDQIAIRKNAKASPESIAEFIAGEFQRRLEDSNPSSSIPFKVANEIYGVRTPAGTTTGVVKPETPKASPNGGPIKVSARPNDSEFADYPDLDMDIIQGRARLKNGRFVTWR